MRLFARRVDVPPNPLAVARALVGRDGFAFLWDATAQCASFVACDPVAKADELDPEPALSLDGTLGPLSRVPRWIGLLPYEARRVLERPAWSAKEHDARSPPHVTTPSWRRYGAVARVAEDVLVVGDDRDRVNDLSSLIRHGKPGAEQVRATLAEAEDEALHMARIERALQLIVEGQIYQVNLARRFVFNLLGRGVDVLERWARVARAPYSISADFDGLTVVGSSPESMLSMDAKGRLLTAPIKGTRPRGETATEDAALRRELDADEKERAELAMVIDVERNDLGRVARTGSVRVEGEPRVVTFGSVHHRVARVSARLRDGVSRTSLLEAMLPSGSVTGAPKIRAMEVVAALESERRGLYTGAFGALHHDGTTHLAMAIRTLTRIDEVAHYFAGGGIVLDSDPEREVRETGWKAIQVARLLAGS